MKKTIFTVAAAATLLLASCDMDKEPIGVLQDDNAVENEQDCLGYRNGVYTNLRALMASMYIYLPAIQGDEFFGTCINGDRLMTFSRGNLYSNNSDTESTFAGIFGANASINFFLNRVDAVIANYEGKDGDYSDQIALINRYIGEAEFGQAYYYYYLADRFCNTPANVDVNAAGTGMPIATLYDPTGDRSRYPGRASLAETYKFIQERLEDSYTRLAAFEKYADEHPNSEAIQTSFAGMTGANAIYINRYAIRALQCRLALIQANYEDCIKYGEEIMNCGEYELATTKGELAKMWEENTSSELIFVPFSNASEACPTTNLAWCGNDMQQADYVPTAYVVNVETKHGDNGLYPSTDLRKTQWFSQRGIKAQGIKINTDCFVKFKPNKSLNSGQTDEWKNRPMPFRLFEVMLNVAESYYMMGNQPKCKEIYMTLRKARNNQYSTYHESWDNALAGADLQKALRKERQRELIGEGYRISDLRRWHEGFDRCDQVNLNYKNSTVRDILIEQSEVQYAPDDYRYVWPIPASELINNPQMRGQQNPGYN